jgi:hypothetical protein
MKPRRLAVYGLTAGLLGGGAAGLALGGTSLAATRIADVTSSTDSTAATDTGAATDPATSSTTDTTASSGGETTTTEAPTTTTSDPAPPTTSTTPAPAAPAAGSAAPKGDWAKSALDPLVAKGTITQAQEDAILAALQAARPDHDGHGGPGRGPGGPGFGNLDAAAKALGMTADDLRTALQGGKSLADVAKAKGIDPAKVVDALVAELKTHLDSEVASGEHTRAEADQILADARARITDFVNGKAPAGGPGFGGPGGPGGPGHGGPGGFGGPGGPGAPAGGSGTSNGSGTTTS